MKFVLPTALLGLLTLPLILLLHVLRERRRRLDIPSLQLWRGLERKTRGTLPKSIPLSLMLFFQLLIAAAISLALARPVVSFIRRNPQQTIFLLDGTTSMAALDTSLNVAKDGIGASRFDGARRVIQEHVAAMADDDTVIIVGLDATPEVLLESDGHAKEQALRTLPELAVGATGIDLQAALTLANGLVDSGRQSQIVVLTDGTYALDAQLLPATNVPTSWHIFPASSQDSDQNLGFASNQALLNVAARTLPDGKHRIFAHVANFGELPVSRTLRVRADGQMHSETALLIPAEDQVGQIWTLPALASTATLEILEPDALLRDNRAQVILEQSVRRRVLLRSDAHEILARSLEAQPDVELTIETHTLTVEDPDAFDAIVFDGLPPGLAALPNGNILVVNPPLGHPLLPAQRYGRSLMPDPKTSSDLLAGMDLSGVFFNRATQVELPDWAKVDLAAIPQTGSPQGQSQPLVFHGSVGDTRLVVWAFDLAASNLPARLALPLLTANTLSSLVAPAPPPVVAAGDPVKLAEGLGVTNPQGERHFLGVDPVFSLTQQPGIYDVFDQADDLGSFAVNAGSALESNLAVQLRLNDRIVSGPPMQPDPAPEAHELELWPLLIVLALSTVLYEGWMAWRR